MFCVLDDLVHRSGVHGKTIRIMGAYFIYLFGVRSEFLSVLEQISWFVTANLGKWAKTSDEIRA